MPENSSKSAIVLTPTGSDGLLIGRVLGRAGIAAEIVQNAEELCRRCEVAAGVVVVAEEALCPAAMTCLGEVLTRQPAWSDLPLIVLTGGGQATRHSTRVIDGLASKGNVTPLERPLRMLTLVSTVRSALRARHRQYEVRDLLEAAAEAVRHRDTFLAMLGHELRNPLSAIRASVAVINGVSIAGELAAEQAGIITRQSSHMARLVDDLLDVARVTTGKIALDRRPIDLREIARRGLQSMSPHNEPRRRAISIELADSPVIVDGDAVRLEQVAANLLSNALRYTPESGSIRVTVRSEGPDAVLTVADNGSGIPSQMLNRIFEPFVQTDQPLARTQGGLGVGLTIVRTLVRMHDGDVRATSGGPGSGSEFIVRLPLAAGRTIAASMTSTTIVNPMSRKVLLLEDNPDTRRAMERLLTMWGHRVAVAQDGAGGLEQMAEDRPEVMLVDLGLPDIDGFEVARRVRTAAGPEIYLIALTGYGQPDDHRRAKAAGFDRHLVKPVSPEKLRGLLADPSVLRTKAHVSAEQTAVHG